MVNQWHFQIAPSEMNGGVNGEPSLIKKNK